MTGQIDAKLADLGITLPTPAAPAANYVSTVISGLHLYVSGQLPFGPNGLDMKGQCGADISVEEGQKAARLCAINLLAQAKSAAGDLDRIARVVKLTVFVSSTPTFLDQPKVANGASDLMVEVLGDKGRHARSAVGVTALPFGVPVEVDAIFELA